VIRLSPGLAQGCFELLEIIGRNALSVLELNEAFPQLGGLPVDDIFSATQRLNWICIDATGLIAITPSGSRAIACLSYEERLRQVLLDYIEVERPPWVQSATFGRMRVIAFAGAGIAQIIVEANLADGDGDDVVNFWDEMATLARGQKDARLNQIGRFGERLTVSYEVNRTNRKPRWVAIDSVDDGYDVLSVVSAEDIRKLTIEVKASTLGLSGSFYLTKNEWTRAQESALHVFHLWSLQNMQSPSLAVLSAVDVAKHVPVNKELGEWSIAEIPFSAFKEKFSVTPQVGF
jgi:hypothetical protein